MKVGQSTTFARLCKGPWQITGAPQQLKAARETNLDSSAILLSLTTSTRVVAMEPKMENFKAVRATHCSKTCVGVSRPSSHLGQRELGCLPILNKWSLRPLCKVSILIITLILPLLSDSSWQESFLSGAGSRL